MQNYKQSLDKQNKIEFFTFFNSADAIEINRGTPPRRATVNG